MGERKVESQGKDAPWPDVPEVRRKIMRANKGSDTKPERRLRSALHRMGYRFALRPKGVPGRPDLTFPGRKKAVFVHGCFWHGHKGCRGGSVPRTRQNYWIPKLIANRERDRRVVQRLLEMGWQSIEVWECELADLDAAAGKVADFLGPPRKRDREPMDRRPTMPESSTPKSIPKNHRPRPD